MEKLQSNLIDTKKEKLIVNLVLVQTLLRLFQ